MNMDKGRILKASDLLPMKAGHTISKGLSETFVVFSMAPDTDISPEIHYEDKCYYVFGGDATVAGLALTTGDLAVIEKNTPLGVHTEDGAYLLEGTWKDGHDMKLEKGKILHLKDQIDYVDGAIANVDIAKNKNLKFALLAFDEGQGLTPHTAPGDALIVALEGRAKVTMGDIEATMEAGDQFVFEKGKSHSVSAISRFKMAILLVID
ncbi:MAG: cupin domain-containing protein [Saccharofermentanales bacterium]|jgi:quercetin dioxygenase-like cupin family protein